MFHKGAMIRDNSGLLEGEEKEGRVAKFSDLDDFDSNLFLLESVVKEWIRMQDAAGK